jgi:hypothetical protein
MSRGDQSESEWRVLKDLLPIEAVNRRRGVAQNIIMQSSTAYLGDLVAVHRGGMLHPNTAIGIRSIGSSSAGAKPGSEKPLNHTCRGHG